MKFKQMLIACIGFLLLSTHSKANKIDSLLIIVKKSKNQKKIKPLFELAELYLGKNNDSALIFNKQAMDIAQSAGDKINQAHALRIEGTVFRLNKENTKALAKFNEALAMSLQVKDKVGEMKTYYSFARLYEKSNQFNKALDYIGKATTVSKLVNDPEESASIYACTGRIYYFLGKYKESMYAFKNALSIYEKLNDQNNISGMSMNLGIMNFRLGNIATSIVFYEKALKSFILQKDTVNQARCVENIALSMEKTNLDSAILLEKKAQKLYALTGEVAAQYGSFLNIGSMYDSKGDYIKSIEYSLKAAKLAEDNKDEYSKAKVYANIAGTYSNLKQYDVALHYAKKALALFAKNKIEFEVAGTYRALANIYLSKGDFDKANQNAETSLKMFIQLGDETAIAKSYLTLGNIQQRTNKPKIALDYFLKSLKLIENKGDLTLIAGLYSNIGVIYYDLKNYPQANIYYQKALEMRKGVGGVKFLTDSYETLANINYAMKNYKEAFDYQTLYVSNREKMLNENVTKQISELNTKYETEKKASEIKLLKKDKINREIKYSESKKRSQIIVVSVSIFTLLCVLIATVLFRSNKRKQKDNELLSAKNTEILEQKTIVEEKNREIMDSIKYAKRIQTAILPPERVVKEYLNESFIIYMPKDIVAGDFYWMEQLPGKIYFAAADCTGHGVPGAMVSVICNNSLNKSVREHHLTEPGDILTKTRELVVAEFEKSDEEVKDGMDIALCCLEGNVLKYAGANNPLWIIRNGKDEIEEIKANKQAVGKVDNPLPFDTHSIELDNGDTIYIFSDGYADQFGGNKGKKMKYGKLKELVLKVKSQNMATQRQILTQEFENWKGELEQIDDVCVIGVRI
jgi:tetratricopeptide (TPR) repeat protein